MSLSASDACPARPEHLVSARVQSPLVLLQAKPVAGPGEMDFGWPREHSLETLGSCLGGECAARPDAPRIGHGEVAAGTSENTLRQQRASGGKCARQAQ